MTTPSASRGSSFLNSTRTLKALCLFLLVAFLGALTWAFIVQSQSVTSFQKQYPYIDVARHLIPQEHFVTTLQPLREYLITTIAEEPEGSVSLYVEYLNTGSNIAINPNNRILPASLIKVPLAMVVMKKVEDGDWRLQDELILMDEDRDSEWGDLYKRPLGSRITVEKLIHEMLVASDNTAFRMLYRNLTSEELQDVVTALGLEDLFTPDGKITTKEYTRLFRALYTSSYLNRAYSQMLLDILTQTSYDSYLGEGIPEGVPFAHKIGENVNDKVMLDAGIIYIENRPLLLSVGIDYSVPGMTREHAHEIMEDVASASYRYISEYTAAR